MFDRGLQAVKDILSKLGPWPMPENYQDSEWNMENFISKLRKHFKVDADFVFHGIINTFDVNDKTDQFKINENPSELKKHYQDLIESVSVVLGAEKGEKLTADVEEVVKFEVKVIKVSAYTNFRLIK